MTLHQWLMPGENIQYRSGGKVHFSGGWHEFLLTNTRLLLYGTRGLFFRKESIIAEPISYITALRYDEQGTFSKQGVLTIFFPHKTMTLSGQPDSLRAAWQTLQHYLQAPTHMHQPQQAQVWPTQPQQVQPIPPQPLVSHPPPPVPEKYEKGIQNKEILPGAIPLALISIVVGGGGLLLLVAIGLMLTSGTAFDSSSLSSSSNTTSQPYNPPVSTQTSTLPSSESANAEDAEESAITYNDDGSWITDEGSFYRVHFARGGTSATAAGTLDKEGDDFLMKAGSGQTMWVEVASDEGKAMFRVKDMQTGEWLTGESPYTNWSGTLPSSGDYDIYIYGQLPDNYVLQVTINY